MLLSLPSRVNNFDYEFMTLRRDDSADKKTLTSAFPSSSARPTRHTTRRAGRDAVSVGGGRVDDRGGVAPRADATRHPRDRGVSAAPDRSFEDPTRPRPRDPEAVRPSVRPVPSRASSDALSPTPSLPPSQVPEGAEDSIDALQHAVDRLESDAVRVRRDLLVASARIMRRVLYTGPHTTAFAR